jgi:hypothetical protein
VDFATTIVPILRIKLIVLITSLLLQQVRMNSTSKVNSVTFLIPNNVGLNYNIIKLSRAAHDCFLLCFAIGVFGRHDNISVG